MQAVAGLTAVGKVAVSVVSIRKRYHVRWDRAPVVPQEGRLTDGVLRGAFSGVVLPRREEPLHRPAVRLENPAVIRLRPLRRRHPPDVRVRVLHSDPFDVDPLHGAREARWVVAHELLAQMETAL